jgi:hypothetical protein
MRRRHQLVTSLTIAGFFTLGACAGNRSYDPYYGDYHRWNGREDGYYRQWEFGTHRDHLSFDRRSGEEQHAYYDWRHR